MPYTITATRASRPVPDQLRVEYELRNGAVLVDTGSVTMTFPNDPTHTAAQRRQTILAIFRQAVRERIQAMRVADADFTAIQTAVQAGQVVVTEGD